MIGKNENKSLNELEERYAAYQKEQTDLHERLDQLSKQISEMNDERIRSAEDGETEKYRALADEVRKLEDEKFVAEKRLAKLQSTPPFSLDEIRAAWKKYHDKYSGDFSTKLDKFKKAKDDFLALYGEMLETQDESSKIRNKLISYMGASYKDKPADFLLPMIRIPFYYHQANGVSLHMGGLRCADADFLFFYHDYLLSHLNISEPYTTDPETSNRFMGILGAPRS